MRDTKALWLIILSILLLGVSLALLWTWGYNYGRKNDNQVVAPKDTVMVQAPPTRDSINHQYADAVNSIGALESTLIKADSVNYDLADKLMEFYKLRDEISGLLNNAKGDQSLSNAQGKITDLQTKIDDLKSQNKSIIKENKRLSALIAQMMSFQQPPKKETVSVPLSSEKDKSPVQEQAAPKPDSTKVVTTERMLRNSSNTIYSLTDISIAGIIENEEGNKSSDQADLINKFTGSFLFHNNFSPKSAGELMVVVQRPDGKVLKPTTWEAGTFETQGGMRVYSSKIKFECGKGESTALSFSIAADEYPKGTYLIEFFQNGISLGKTSKTLN